MSARKIIVERPIADEFIDAARREDAGPEGRATRRSTTRSSARSSTRTRSRLVKGRVDDAVAEGRAGARRRRGRRAVLPGDAAHRRARRLRLRPARDVRPGRRRSRSSTAPTRRSSARTRPRTGSRAGILTGDADRGLALARAARVGHRPRQRPAGRRRAADAVRRRQGQRLGPVRRARRRSTSSPSSAGSRCRAARTRSRSERAWPRSSRSRGGARARPRRRHRRARGLHAPDPARRRARADPPGAARPDARPHDARRRSTTS